MKRRKSTWLAPSHKRKKTNFLKGTKLSQLENTKIDQN
jgi:hypothetical protein